MVIVTNYFLREGDKGNYVTLQLEGELELVQSQNTGRFYATTRRCNIYSTFDEATAFRMIGSTMPGSIVRVPCEPYEYTIPETGQVVMLAFSWDYIPEEVSEIRSKPKPRPIALVEYSNARN